MAITQPFAVSELQLGQWTAQEKTSHWHKLLHTPRRLFYIVLDAVGEKQHPWNIHLFSFLLFPHICFLHHLMPSPKMRIVKHLHQLQADMENPFKNSHENSICLIHFAVYQETTILSYKFGWCYSSTFKLFPPSFRPHACINKYNLYWFIPLALSTELMSSVFEWLLDIIYLIQNEHWVNW